MMKAVAIAQVRQANAAWLQLFTHKPVVHKPTGVRVHILGTSFLNLPAHSVALRRAVTDLKPVLFARDQLPGDEGWLREYSVLATQHLEVVTGTTIPVESDVDELRFNATKDWAGAALEPLLNTGCPEEWVYAMAVTGMVPSGDEVLAAEAAYSLAQAAAGQGSSRKPKRTGGTKVECWRDPELSQAESLASRVARLKASPAGDSGQAAASNRLAGSAAEAVSDALDASLAGAVAGADIATKESHLDSAEPAATEEATSPSLSPLEDALQTVFTSHEIPVEAIPPLETGNAFLNSTLQDLLLTPDAMADYRAAIRDVVKSGVDEALTERVGLFDMVYEAKTTDLVGRINVACLQLLASGSYGLGGPGELGCIVVCVERKFVPGLLSKFQSEKDDGNSGGDTL
ncbi:hypothetical protein DFJ73DRAFT_809094, partial [Zopfochytrium polystomum]